VGVGLFIAIVRINAEPTLIRSAPGFSRWEQAIEGLRLARFFLRERPRGVMVAVFFASIMTRG